MRNIDLAFDGTPFGSFKTSKIFFLCYYRKECSFCDRESLCFSLANRRSRLLKTKSLAFLSVGLESGEIEKQGVHEEKKEEKTIKKKDKNK